MGDQTDPGRVTRLEERTGSKQELTPTKVVTQTFPSQTLYRVTAENT